MDLPKQSYRASFFTTDRGHQAVQHALEVAQSYLAASARAIEIRFVTEVAGLLDVTCDHTISLEDDRLPGRKVRGKVKSYRLFFGGDSGEAKAEIILGCGVGMPRESSSLLEKDSEKHAEEKPESLYVVLEYEEGGYQSRPSRLTRTPSGLGFYPFHHQMPKSGILYPHRLQASNLVTDLKVVNPPEQQEKTLLDQQYPLTHDVGKQLDDIKTDIHIDLLDVRPSGILEHGIRVKIPTPWTAPCQIDLGEES